MSKSKNLKWIVLLALASFICTSIIIRESYFSSESFLPLKSSMQKPSSIVQQTTTTSSGFHKEINYLTKQSSLLVMPLPKAIEYRQLRSTNQEIYIAPNERTEGHLGAPPTAEMVLASPDGKL